MRFFLASTAVAAVLTMGSAPVLAADWTGFYAGFYGGLSARSSEDMTFNGVAGLYDRADNQNHPDTYANPDSIPSDLFDMLTDISSQILNINTSEAVGAHLDGTATYGHGKTIGSVVGYSFGNGLRIEQDNSVSYFALQSLMANSVQAYLLTGEYDGVVPGQFNWNIDSTIIDDTDIDVGSVPFVTSAVFILGDAWWDFDNDSAVTPYVGAGAGIAILTHAFDAGEATPSSNSIVPAAQVGAGLRIDLNETSFLDLGYRLKVADGSTAHSSDEVVDDPFFYAYDMSSSGLYIQHTVQLGLNMRLK
jgi:opacity protein-like surface antigen